MIITALVLGFAGSLHCLTMCSPLAMAVTAFKPKAVVNRALYNTGRIVMYGVQGAVVASVGLVFPFVRFQNLFSVALGLVLIALSLTGMSVLRMPFVTATIRKISNNIKGWFGKFLSKKTYSSVFVLGSLNGLLPCGLTFVALTYCLALAGPVDGSSFMFWFGIGTLPVMMGFTSVFSWTTKRLRLDVRKVTAGMLMLSGILLVARVYVTEVRHAQSFRSGLMEVVLCK